MSSELHLVLQCRMQMAAPFEPARRDVPAGQCPIRLTSAVEKLTVARYCKAAKLASVRAGRRLSPTSLLSSDNACQSDTGSKYGRPFASLDSLSLVCPDYISCIIRPATARRPMPCRLGTTSIDTPPYILVHLQLVQAASHHIQNNRHSNISVDSNQ